MYKVASVLICVQVVTIILFLLTAIYYDETTPNYRNEQGDYTLGVPHWVTHGIFFSIGLLVITGGLVIACSVVRDDV